MSLIADPGDVAGWVRRGCDLHGAGDLGTAITCYRRALRLAGERLPLAVFHNLALALLNRADWAGLAACCRAAAALFPDDPQTPVLLGNALTRLGRYPAAVAAYDVALALIPANLGVRYSRGILRLLTGDFVGGWDDYAARWVVDPPRVPPDHLTQWPRWRGEIVRGGALLLWGEPGVGDEILFTGLLPELLATRTFSALIVECDTRLVPLLRRSFPAVTVVGRDADLSKLPIPIIAQAPLSDLPALLRPNLAAFPPHPAPWLIADPERVAALRARYAGQARRIGIAWFSAVNGDRSLPLAALLAALPADCRPVSLQAWADPADNLDGQPDGRPNGRVIFDPDTDPLGDIDGFAALVAAMDLVISVDNSTLHVAGALGVPVLALIPADPAWYWGDSGENCRWYPNIRLLRQERVGDWSPVLEQLARLVAQCGEAG